MLVSDLPVETIPYLLPEDSINSALQLMLDNQISHLPIVNNGKYEGVLSEDDLLNAPDVNEPLTTVSHLFHKTAVGNHRHFLSAVKIAADQNLSIVPVKDKEDNYLGVITYHNLLKYVSQFLNLHHQGALIVLEIEPRQFSFSELSKLVESNNGQIMQLNTFVIPENGMMQVAIRLSSPDVSDILATFQRYEYSVKYYFGEEHFTNTLQNNYENLMAFLNI